MTVDEDLCHCPFQFWIFVIATPVMLVGLYFTLGRGTMVSTIIGSIGVFLGAALFAVDDFWQVRQDRLHQRRLGEQRRHIRAQKTSRRGVRFNRAASS